MPSLPPPDRASDCPAAEFWDRKLAAFLHDSPEKVLELHDHAKRAKVQFVRAIAGTDSEEPDSWAHGADHAAAAADRFPFPSSRASGLQCAFDGVRAQFRHPLGGKAELPFDREFPSAEYAEGKAQTAQPTGLEGNVEDPADAARLRFLAHWRLYRKWLVESDYRFAFLPADTRLPDHTVWHHLGVVSALQGCIEGEELRPAFLKFQLGGVQDLIAAAKLTRDLWSGSYLLSWLMGVGLKKLADLQGPDSVIFPSLWGQPIFDWLSRHDYRRLHHEGADNAWDALDGLKPTPADVLTPNLPNVFLAVVPAAKGAALAQAVEQAMRDEWKRIADACWQACAREGLFTDEGAFKGVDRRARFDRQVAGFLSVSWQVTPWTVDRMPDPESEFAFLPKAQTTDSCAEAQEKSLDKEKTSDPRERIRRIINAVCAEMPWEQRDGRYYVKAPEHAKSDDPKKREPKTQLNNPGLGWALYLAENAWLLDGARSLRAFAGSLPPTAAGTSNEKDALNGREEAVAGGREWQSRCAKLGEGWDYLFKTEDWVGASTLIKRIWHVCYLRRIQELPTKELKMPHTRGLAQHKPFSASDDDDEDEQQGDETPGYFAVLALDGDDMGKWVSGEKCPKLRDQLAAYCDGSKNPAGALAYFERADLIEKFAEVLDTPRPLTPAFHLQFSEALANFALRCARTVVESYDGRLIYAGGDDVVAMLPADSALDCAEALRLAFRGDTGLTDYISQTATARKFGRNGHVTGLKCHTYGKVFEKEAVEAEGDQHLHQKCHINGTPYKDGEEIRFPGFVQDAGLADSLRKPIPLVVPGPGADVSVGVAIAHHKTPLQDVVREAQKAEKRAKMVPGKAAVAVSILKRSGEITEWESKFSSGGLGLLRHWLARLQAGQHRPDDQPKTAPKDGIKPLNARFPYKLTELLEPYLGGKPEDFNAALAEKDRLQDLLRNEVAHALRRTGGTDNESADLLKAYLENLLAPPKDEKLSEAEAVKAKRAHAAVKSLVGLLATLAWLAKQKPGGADPDTSSRRHAGNPPRLRDGDAPRPEQADQFADR